MQKIPELNLKNSNHKRILDKQIKELITSIYGHLTEEINFEEIDGYIKENIINSEFGLKVTEERLKMKKHIEEKVISFINEAKEFNEFHMDQVHTLINKIDTEAKKVNYEIKETGVKIYANAKALHDQFKAAYFEISNYEIYPLVDQVQKELNHNFALVDYFYLEPESFTENENPAPPDDPTPVDPKPTTRTIVTSITVQTIDHEAVIKGYSDKTFRPNENITREEVAAILARLDKNYNDKNDYRNYLDGIKDVKKTSWSANYLGYLVSKKVIVPNANCINPTNKATRAEVVKMISTLKGYESYGKVSTFKDSNGHWYDPYVATLESRNIIDGYKDHTFKGTNYMTRAEFTKLICLASGRNVSSNKVTTSIKNMITSQFKDVKKDSWYFNYLLEMSFDHAYNFLH